MKIRSGSQRHPLVILNINMLDEKLKFKIDKKKYFLMFKHKLKKVLMLYILICLFLKRTYTNSIITEKG